MRLFAIAEARESFPRVASHRPPVKKLIEIVGKTLDVFKTSSTSGAVAGHKIHGISATYKRSGDPREWAECGNYETECFV